MRHRKSEQRDCFVTYLKARKAEYDEQRERKLSIKRLEPVHLDHVPQSTEPEPAEAAIARLVQEQQRDERTDERMASAHARRRSW
jgi:hypothetical protein